MINERYLIRALQEICDTCISKKKWEIQKSLEDLIKELNTKKPPIKS